MLFTSFEYFIFLPFAVALFYLFPQRYRWSALLLTSVIFLVEISVPSVVIAALIAVFNYFISIQLEKNPADDSRKLIFRIALTVNIICLLSFKYILFFLNNLLDLYDLAAQKDSPDMVMSILQPIGLSYYIFSLIGYNYEIYVNEEKAERHFGHFLTFVLYFPKMVSGPIERPHQFLPQLNNAVRLHFDNIREGFTLILWGVFKKAVISDRMGIIVDSIYDSPMEDSLLLFTGMLLYPMQIYTDFSGYTDIARGSSRLMGIDLMKNFNIPFFSRSISEFWRRWHISLSSWVNDYIYAPLSMYVGINRNWGKWGIIVTVVISFTILGFWHGPNWTFIAFGFLQSVAISYEILTRKNRKKIAGKIPPRIYALSSILITYLYYSFTCVFFRSDNISQAFQYLGNMVSKIKRPDVNSFIHFIQETRLGTFLGYTNFLIALIGILVILLVNITWQSDDLHSLLKNKSRWKSNLIYYGLILFIIIFGYFETQNFIYVQF